MFKNLRKFLFIYLKSQLCKYFNVNGIPYMTLVELKLDKRNLKIIDFKTEKRNIKHEFLVDESAKNFPWFNNITQSDTITDTSVNENDSDISSINNGLNKCAKKKDTMVDQKHDDSSRSDPMLYPLGQQVLNELFANLIDINTIKKTTSNEHNTSENNAIKQTANVINSRQVIVETILKDNNFLFILVGSNDFSENALVVQSMLDFSKQFSNKHKFLNVYLEINKKNDHFLVDVDFSGVNWFTVLKKEIKVNYLIII